MNLPHNGVAGDGFSCASPGFFYQIQAGLLGSLSRPHSVMDLVHLRVMEMERLWE